METFVGTKKNGIDGQSIDKEEKARAKEQKKITKSESEMMAKILASMYVKTFGKTPVIDVVKYSLDRQMNLVEILNEIREKKSKLSSASRKLVTTSDDTGRLKYLALALNIKSGLSAEDDFEIIEDKQEEAVTLDTDVQKSEIVVGSAEAKAEEVAVNTSTEEATND